MEAGSAQSKRKYEGEVEDGDTLDSIIEESLRHKQIKQEGFGQHGTSGTDNVLQFENEAYGLSLADGIVTCGQCKQQRASTVCMEHACVSYAYRTWQMTSLFICDGCDAMLHDTNPIMAEHIRTKLAIRRTNVVVRSFENRKTMAGLENSTISSARKDVEVRHADDTPDVSRMDVETSTTALKHPTLHSKLCSSRQLNLMLEKIHNRYRTVLEHNLSRYCPLSDTFRETGVARQTLIDAIAIAELKIVDSARFDEVMVVLSNARTAPRMFELESECRVVMRDYLDAVASLRGKSLIPFKCNVYSAKK